MTFVCLWSPAWETAGAPLAEVGASLMEAAPRVAVGAGVVWADGRGLDAAALAASLLARAGALGVGARAGVAGVPVAAEAAARHGGDPVTAVRAGCERDFLAAMGLDVLDPDPRTRALLQGAGIRRCGDLAALPREAAEVRFGAEGARLWRLSRGDDPRLLFRPIPAEAPHAAIDFLDYAITDAARLAFAAHGALASVCATLKERGERARRMVLELPLSGGGTVTRVLRTARPTAERDAWSARVRGELERLALPDAAVGVSLRVEGQEPASATQGDLFDRGFATAAPVEETVARLADAHGALLVAPDVCAHPLADARTTWRPLAPEEVSATRAAPALAGLTLQLLPEPRPVRVEARPRRDHAFPARLRDGGVWCTVAEAAGPDRVSGGHTGERPFAREYFRCATDDGRLVWLFRDALEEGWFLHGWWD